jgi:hypothetical protein
LKLRFPAFNLPGCAAGITPERSSRRTSSLSTIIDWLPVFQSPACCDILVQSLDYCRREKGLKLYARVIMENHFHAVVQSDQLPRVMADLKKFTAGKLLAQLKAERRDCLPDFLPFPSNSCSAIPWALLSSCYTAATMLPGNRPSL